MNTKSNTDFDAIIIGAGAAGLFCAMTAGARGLRVLVLDHADTPGKKILISGGGRCNFTNLESTPDRFLSKNPHFCKSALAQYTQYDFIDLVQKHKIAYHEKTLGQLFCDGSAKLILQMLLGECKAASVDLRLNHVITELCCETVVSRAGMRRHAIVPPQFQLPQPAFPPAVRGSAYSEPVRGRLWRQ